MALLDSDALLRSAYDALFANNGNFNTDIEHVIDWLKLCEREYAVDAAPVVHGHWIKHIDDLFPEDSMIECSKCHEYTLLLPDDNYCPACGAKMDEED